MLRLPKVHKVVGGLTKIETVRKVVLAAALGVGLSIAGPSATKSFADVTKRATVTNEANPKLSGGALLLTPSTMVGEGLQTAQHYSHWSHSSHSSHSSHYSHYSSR